MEITLELLNKKRAQADLCVAGFFEKEKAAKALESLGLSFAEVVQSSLKKGSFEGKFSQWLTSHSADSQEASEIAVFGLGLRKNHKKICMRKAAGQILQFAKNRKAVRLSILIDTFTNSEVSQSDAVGIFTEVARLAMYEFNRYKSKKDENIKKLTTLQLLTEDAKHKTENQKRMAYAHAVAEGILTARDLINEPANVMTPEKLAKSAEEMAEQKNIACEFLSQGEMEQMKMGGILGVNQGSRYQASMIVLEYGKRYKKNGTVCIVGKGVTFDTGGLSIKPADGMEKMKYDMSGAAAVIGTLGAVADLKLPLHVVGIAPTVENNVAEDPIRPGDIIRMYNGKTVEVVNTDAEGRLILGDALSYAAKFEPDAIIDLATLTGMCAFTFGDKAIGLMGNNEKLIHKVKEAGLLSGERCWELPMYDEYKEQIKGHHSDLLNTGGRYAGTITAAKFLEEFVPEKTAWVHLDIAGTAWADSNRPDCPKGGTGVGVRLLTQFLSQYK